MNTNTHLFYGVWIVIVLIKLSSNINMASLERTE